MRIAQHLSTSRPPRVERARTKHPHDNLHREPTEAIHSPSLSDRFHALPTELRRHIFSFLLAQPVKWNAHHTPACILHDGDWACRDDYYDYTLNTDGCVRCHRWPTSVWRSCNRILWIPGPFVGPWRSQWASEQLNPWVCTECYDANLRSKPFPRARSLPCICARREHLEILLICRKWYEEAAELFHTSNIFAFEDCGTFFDFVHHLFPRWRANISKISLMAYYLEDDSKFEFPKSFGTVCSYLRRLPSLSHLELDAVFLTRTDLLLPLLRLGLPSQTKIYFTLRRPSRLLPDLRKLLVIPEVWPELANRVLLKGGLPEEIARAMRGERRPWLPRSKRARLALLGRLVDDYCKLVASNNDAHVFWQRLWYEVQGRGGIFAGGATEKVDVHCGDMEEWERLWYAANLWSVERARVCPGFMGRSFEEQVAEAEETGGCP
ncbi:hypothetical protein EJ03DRAFT_326836 [Teratosphaeria nubilosa]|uniref:Uncharacterized protein n=1 Tax=Teratosphaeria nubilosa TaxID=161662 RepID=A0A6G1LBI4_9PEZI|nr:hypothetical protein EJ03DRAFT_326836 [Teratosphaeria nubilosa]